MVNNEIPSDGKIISGLDQLLKKFYIPTDWLNLGINNKISSEGLQNYLSIIKEKKFNFIILYEGAIENHPLKKCISEKFTSSNEFLRATRNPLNRNKAQKIEIYNFNFSKLPYCVN